ncbi:MAG: TraR/DksA family transcriptional regulator [Patescibacteria group bacterium]
MKTKIYKEKLEEELKLLEKELGTVGRINPDNPNDWEATGDVEMNKDDTSDPNDNADKMEELGTRQAILTDLEIRFHNVKNALKRIENNEFGKCEVCGKEIEEKRLDANPAATTCIEHKE